MFNKLAQRTFLCNVQVLTRARHRSLFSYVRNYNTTGLRESTQLPSKLGVQLQRKELTFGEHLIPL
jgi:hypothetical protein